MSDSVDILSGLEICSYFYFVFGSICVSLNLIVLWVHFSSKELRTKYISSIVLCSAHLITGVSFISLGIWRLWNFEYKSSYKINESNECFSYILSFLLIVGAQLPAITSLVVAIEKIIAAKKPIWYYNYWSTNHRITFSGVGLGLCMVSISIGYIITHNRPSRLDLNCIMSVISTFGYSYGTYSYIFPMVLYVAKFLIFWMVYLQHCTQFLEKRKRVEQLKVMFAGASALCVTYYTIMNLLTWFSYFRARTLLIGTGDCVYLVCCSFSLFLYSSTRDDFKKEFEKSVFGRFLSVYTPINGTNGTSRNETTTL